MLPLGSLTRQLGLRISMSSQSGADDFEISSTLRQLIEIWQVNNEDPPGYKLLPILRAAKLNKEGGGLTVPVQEARRDLEKVFGSDGSLTLTWYQTGLGARQIGLPHRDGRRQRHRHRMASEVHGFLPESTAAITGSDQCPCGEHDLCIGHQAP